MTLYDATLPQRLVLKNDARVSSLELIFEQIIGTTYTGEYEDVKAINDLLVERNIDCPIHVDAASGGFVAPFVNPSLEWDFRLSKVVSINVSGHKYGLVRLFLDFIL